MAPGKQQHKRKNYFIKKEFQFKFIIKFSLIIFAGTILSTGLVFLFSQESLTSSFENSRLVIKNTGYAIMPAVIITNLITLGVITLAAIGVTLFVSHRIAGPIFRFEQDIKRVAKGDLSVRIQLRQKDQFSEMERAFNEMIESIHDKVTEIDHEIDRMLTSKPEPKTFADYEKRASELKKLIHKNFSL